MAESAGESRRDDPGAPDDAADEDRFLAFCVWTVWSRILGWTVVGLIAGYLAFGLFLRAGTLEHLGIPEERFLLLFLAELSLGALIFGGLGLQRGAWRAARGLALDDRTERLAAALFASSADEEDVLERSAALFSESGPASRFRAEGLSSPAAAAVSVVAGAAGRVSRQVLRRFGDEADGERWSAAFKDALVVRAGRARRRWTIALTLVALSTFAGLLGLFRGL